MTIKDITELINIYLSDEAEESGYKAFDLGLSVKWANMNVGASSPEDYGNYYAWGSSEISEHSGIKYAPWLSSEAHIMGDHYKYNFSKYRTPCRCRAACTARHRLLFSCQTFGCLPENAYLCITEFP